MRPYKFQVECVNEIDWLGGRALVACEPGLGKTVIALMRLRRHPDTLPAIVVCPKSAKYVWEDMTRIVLGRKPEVLEGYRVSPLGDSSVVVLNYDLLSRWLPLLRQLRPRTIVCDECQYLANETSERTQAARQLCKKVPSVLMLSATPLVNKPIELYPALSILQPDKFPSRLDFAEEYCSPTWTPWGWRFSGCSKPKELHQLLVDTVMVRRRKEEVLSDLPDKIISVVPVALSNREEYRKADTDFREWVLKLGKSKARSALRAEGLTKAGYLLSLSAQLKLPFVVEWIQDFLDASEEKLVVFAIHKGMIRGLQDAFRSTKHVTIVGGTSERQRRIAVDQFQNDNKTRLFFGNLWAAGTAITLTASSNVAFVELGWRPGDFDQAVDRCHRIGSKNTVWGHYLIARGTIEEKMCKIIQRKQRDIRAILDGEVRDSGLDVLSELVRAVAKEKR